MEYTANAYALDGNSLIPGNLESTDYTNGKDGFFKIDYINTGYVKLDLENNVLLGGWERDEASVNAPTRTQAAIDTPSDYNWGYVYKGAVLFSIPNALKVLKKTAADANPTITSRPDVYRVLDDSWFYCLDEDPKPITAANSWGKNAEIGLYDIFTSPSSAKKEDQILPDNSGELCFEANTTTRTIAYIPFLITKDESYFRTLNLALDVSVAGPRRSYSLATLRTVSIQNRISQVGYFDHPVFGRVRVNAYNKFVNPYTSKEEDLALVNNKVTFESTDISVGDLNVELYNSTSYEANHVVRLLSRYYQLTSEERENTTGIKIMDEILDVSRQHSIICTPKSYTLDEFTKTYESLLYKNTIRGREQESKDQTKLINYPFVISGYLEANQKENIEIECRSYITDSTSGGLHKYLGYVFERHSNRISKNNANNYEINDEINNAFVADQKQYDLFCILYESKGESSFQITDEQRLAKYKERFTNSVFTTWTEAKSSIKLLPSWLAYRKSYNKEGGGLVLLRYYYECYEVNQ